MKDSQKQFTTPVPHITKDVKNAVPGVPNNKKVGNLGQILIGSFIEWKSPLFGLLTGSVLMVPGDGTVLISDHPMNNKGEFGPAFIKEDWVIRVVK